MTKSCNLEIFNMILATC